MLPLAVREMHAWVDGTNAPPEDKSQTNDRVVVIHCKGTSSSSFSQKIFISQLTAGKGRSGTLACAYLLTAPTLVRSENISAEHARSESTLCELSRPELISATSSAHDFSEKLEYSSAPSYPNFGSLRRRTTSTHAGMRSPSVPLAAVLRLHAEKRMKATTSKSGKQRQGVSIPSQQRFLSYWARIVSKDTPGDFWAVEPRSRRSLNVRLCNITVKMSDLSPTKSALFKLVNQFHHILGRAKASEAQERSPVWASLSRYDDDFVNGLEQREWDTRPDDETERRETEHNSINKFLDDGQWDSQKMVHSFARLQAAEEDAPQHEVSLESLATGTYLLTASASGEGCRNTHPPPRDI